MGIAYFQTNLYGVVGFDPAVMTWELSIEVQTLFRLLTTAASEVISGLQVDLPRNEETEGFAYHPGPVKDD